MIAHFFKEAFRLITRSKTECLVYLLGLIISEALVLAACRRLGVAYPLHSPDPGVAGLIRLVACSAPPVLITSWLGAGLIGRISMDASKGATGTMISYANGWFIRNLIGTLIISAAAFLPAFVLMVLPKTLSAAGILVWFLFFIWLAIRISMWPNIMFIEGLGPIAAMGQSFRKSEGYAIPLALLSLPLFVRVIWEMFLPNFPAGNVFVSGLSKNLLIGAATLVQIGALATVYLTITRNPSVSGENTAR